MSAASSQITASEAEKRTQSGLLVGVFCYVLWGFLPLLFDILKPAGSIAVVANRTVWSLLFVGALLIATRRMGEVMAALRNGRILRTLALSAVLLAVNWLIYVWAVETGQALEGSFGYFINPMINVAIGMALLGERQNPWQLTAIAVAVFALAVQWVGLGRIPFIALSVAITFGFYGYVRKIAHVEAASGLFVETLLLLPLAIAYIAWSLITAGPGIYAQPFYLVMLIVTGPATSVPLMLFAFAVRRLRLTTIGMIQYVSPTIQFLLAIFVLHEPINMIQLLSFGLIWVSLIIYSADSVLRRRTTPTPAPAE